MTTTKFDLKTTTTLIPVSGLTTVSINTTGACLIHNEATASKREPAIVLGSTEHGRLTLSPKGKNVSAHVYLPVGLSSEDAFIEEIRQLYSNYRNSWN